MTTPLSSLDLSWLLLEVVLEFLPGFDNAVLENVKEGQKFFLKARGISYLDNISQWASMYLYSLERRWKADCCK